jgi:hypothetical protein
MEAGRGVGDLGREVPPLPSRRIVADAVLIEVGVKPLKELLWQ